MALCVYELKKQQQQTRRLWCINNYWFLTWSFFAAVIASLCVIFFQFLLTKYKHKALLQIEKRGSIWCKFYSDELQISDPSTLDFLLNFTFSTFSSLSLSLLVVSTCMVMISSGSSTTKRWRRQCVVWPISSYSSDDASTSSEKTQKSHFVGHHRLRVHRTTILCWKNWNNLLNILWVMFIEI